MQSVVALPLFAIAMPMTGMVAIPAPTAIISDNSTAIVTPLLTPEEEAIRSEHAKAIDDFLTMRKSPLAGYGRKFVDEAEKNGIDWRLLVATSGRESTFGLHMCKRATAPNNAWGWNSCKSGFKSIDQAIEVISKKLGGNDPSIKHYKTDMTSEQILKKYNPDSIVQGYSKQVVRIMKLINNTETIG